MCTNKNLNSARTYKLGISSDFPAKSVIVSNNENPAISEGI